MLMNALGEEVKITPEEKKYVYLAVKHINKDSHYGWQPFPKTIASFLSGATNSPFYEVFKLYKDCFNKIPNCKKVFVEAVALELINEGFLTSENGKYLIKRRYQEPKPQINKSSGTKKTDPEIKFLDTLNNKQKDKIKKVTRILKKLDPNLQQYNQKHFFGYRYPPIEGKDNPYWFRFRRNAKNKIEFVLRNTPSSKQEDVIILNDSNIPEIGRRLEIIFSKSVGDIQIIRQRIQQKDDFHEFDYQNSETIHLMPHQKAGIYLSMLYNKFAFFYDTGTGKTIMTLEIIFEKWKKEGARFLIIAPKPLIKSAWMEDASHYSKMKILPLSSDINNVDYANLYNAWNEVDGISKRIKIDHLLGRVDSDVDMKKIKEDLMARAHHFIINIDRIRQPQKGQELLKQIKVNGLIVDESSILKNYESRNSLRVRVLAKQMKYVYLLSGKPAPNGIHEFYSQLVIVAPKVFNLTYHKFITKYFETKENTAKVQPINEKAKREISRMVASASITVNKKDCIELPKQISFSTKVQLEDEAMRMYQSVFKNFVTEITSLDGKSVKAKAMPMLAKIAKLREIASGFYLKGEEEFFVSEAKLKALTQLVKKLGDQQILIWCNFIYEINLIKDTLSNLGYRVATVYGKTKDVYTTLKDFKENTTQILIAHPKTIKYGVTLVNCHHAIFNSMSYSFEDYYQAHDRIYRIGQKSACNFHHLISKDTIDEAIYSKIQRKALDSSVFEELIKMASRFNVSKEGIEKLKRLSEKTIRVAEDEVNVDEKTDRIG